MNTKHQREALAIEAATDKLLTSGDRADNFFRYFLGIGTDDIPGLSYADGDTVLKGMTALGRAIARRPTPESRARLKPSECRVVAGAALAAGKTDFSQLAARGPDTLDADVLAGVAELRFDQAVAVEMSVDIGAAPSRGVHL